MNVRTTLLAASVALLAFAGCGGDRNTNTIPGSDGGCTANCGAGDSGTPDSGTPDSGTPDSGTPDSGTPDSGTPDSGVPASSCADYPTPDGGAKIDAGTLTTAIPATLRQIRYAHADFGSHVLVTGVVITDISYASATNTEFWVTDPNDPVSGMWVHLRSTDTLAPSGTTLAAGDIVNIDGFFSDESKTDTHGFARRYVLANNYVNSTATPMTVTVTATAASLPAANAVDAGCLGNNEQGNAWWPQGAMPFAGTRVHFNGPLTITTAQPVALTRVTADDAGTLVLNGYNGFEVTGGILVDDYATYKANDGGCNWGGMLNDGGTVTFPNGIDGVWDTYSLAVFNPKVAGYVPNSTAVFPDAGQRTYTFALYPQNCGDLPGEFDAGM